MGECKELKIFQTKVKFTSECYKHWNEVQYDIKNERYLVDIFSRYPNVIKGLKYTCTSLPHGVDHNWEPPADELLHFRLLQSTMGCPSSTPRTLQKTSTCFCMHHLSHLVDLSVKSAMQLAWRNGACDTSSMHFVGRWNCCSSSLHHPHLKNTLRCFVPLMAWG